MMCSRYCIHLGLTLIVYRQGRVHILTLEALFKVNISQKKLITGVLSVLIAIFGALMLLSAIP